MTLGEKIYSLRMREGLSQEAFGEKLGVSRQSVSKWETDQSVPELDKIVMISELFAVSTDYLLKESAEEQQMEHRKSLDAEQVDHTAGAHTFIKPRAFYEYKSKTSWRGLPLVHINIGFGRRAKGVIAIGLTARGIIAIGLAALGVITVAPVGIGLLLSVGMIAVGGIAMGTFAFGAVAIGSICVGLFSMGALAVGQFSFGAMAVGQQVAVGDVARGDIALGFSEATGTVFEQVTGRQGGFDPQEVLQVIDENVSDGWFIFKEWIKAMIRIGVY